MCVRVCSGSFAEVGGTGSNIRNSLFLQQCLSFHNRAGHDLINMAIERISLDFSLGLDLTIR